MWRLILKMGEGLHSRTREQEVSNGTSLSVTDVREPLATNLTMFIR